MDTATLIRIAHAKASRMAGKYGFSCDEAEDLGQELLADLVARWPHFDPDRGNAMAFIRRVMENRIATILEGRRAQCRDYRRTADGGLSAGDPIDAGGSKDAEMRDLSIDVRRLRDQLRPELASIAVLLPSKKLNDIGRQLGLSRSTLYRRLRELRSAAAGLGLDRYLGGDRLFRRNRP